MSNISVPATIADAPAASRPLLEAIEKRFGTVPNLFRLVSNSPSALEGYLNLSKALSKGTLSAQTGERIALAIAEINGCDYCLSAHAYLGKNLANLDDAEITANRSGRSNDAKADIAVQFAARLALNRGRVSEADVRSVKGAGYTDADIIEIVLHVALSVFTNYTNIAAKTAIDFPAVARHQDA
ncbi:carboxymuconolactone decarboxylase family protein [Paraburkholderia rhizosphaerae]|uniref:Putative peroxidase-related enzyme n=1 Tax=Paraburkholderia rhizosphaerae TaxID=480658 RepID=A0A4V3HF68_9BURK|nr:carboxymuconolactone decarboxylase family protein [Paraburkholderia rhizosphaerae]TDY51681.1 putative peroxidase-related enzyme [Paraburkholderia rhizosphaerae]